MSHLVPLGFAKRAAQRPCHTEKAALHKLQARQRRKKLPGPTVCARQLPEPHATRFNLGSPFHAGRTPNVRHERQPKAVRSMEGLGADSLPRVFESRVCHIATLNDIASTVNAPRTGNCLWRHTFVFRELPLNYINPTIRIALCLCADLSSWLNRGGTG